MRSWFVWFVLASVVVALPLAFGLASRLAGGGGKGILLSGGFPGRPDGAAVARDMGFALYPGAISGGGAWGGSSSGGRANFTGHLSFSVAAPPGKVLAFYQQQYANCSPVAVSARGVWGDQTLLLWEDGRGGSAVLVERHLPTNLLLIPLALYATEMVLTRTNFDHELVSETPGAQTVRRAAAPEELGLSVCPGATVDYSGWTCDQSGAVAMARIRVAGSVSPVVAFYRELARQHGAMRGGSSTHNGNTMQASERWRDGAGDVSVSLLHPGTHLPAIVWLQRAAHRAENYHQ